MAWVPWEEGPAPHRCSGRRERQAWGARLRGLLPCLEGELAAEEAVPLQGTEAEVGHCSLVGMLEVASSWEGQHQGAGA